MTFDESAQKAMLEMVMYDDGVFTTVKPILNPDFFDKKFQTTVQYLIDFHNKYATLPTKEQVNMESHIEFKDASYDCSNVELKKSICDLVEQFCKQRALEIAVLEAADRVNNGEKSGIDSIIKKAQLISLEKDIGIEFWEEQETWLNQIDVEMGSLTTGWKTFDDMLNGGIAWGDLVYVVSCSGGGKSLAMANLGLNYSTLGYNVVYLTLELDKALVGKRIMAMASNIPYRQISHKPDDVINKLIYKRQNIKPGAFRIVDVENGSTPTDIEALIKTIEAKLNIIVNVVIIDYADLMRCNEHKQIKAENTHLIGKKIAEELRAFAKRRTKNGRKTVILTASQIGKDAMSEMEYDMSNIAGSAGKSFTADLIFSVRTNLSMKQQGKYELKVIKARNSGATDRKMFLKYNVDTLLMEDLEEVKENNPLMENSTTKAAVSTLMDKLSQNAV